MEWMEFKGEGKLAAFTDIVVAPPFMAKEGYGKNNPYVVGVVELNEGVKIVARITGINAKKPEEIKVGMPLKAEIIASGPEGEKKVYLTFHPWEIFRRGTYAVSRFNFKMVDARSWK